MYHWNYISKSEEWLSATYLDRFIRVGGDLLFISIISLIYKIFSDM